MAVRIVCDSAADIILPFAERKNISVLPLKTIIDGKEYLDGIELTPSKFYEIQASTKDFPTTSQIAPTEFSTEFEKWITLGDDVVVITISSGLSGTYQSACIAASEYENRVFVVDSLNATIGEQLLVHLAIKLQEKGMCAKDIAEELTAARDKIRLLASFDTLEFLFRGGRLSRTSAVAGAMLNIKPIFTIENGKLDIIAKARGIKARNTAMNDIVKVCGEIDFSLPVLSAYTGSSNAQLKEYLGSGTDIWKTADIEECLVGSTVGAHAGPDAVAVAFFIK